MKVTRVGENEIRCILSEEEMVAFGIDLDDILEKNIKSGKFFNEILSRAATALGEADAGELRGCSAQISVLDDRSISILLRTRKEHGAGDFSGALRDAVRKKKRDNRSFLIFFKSIDDAVSFCKAGKGAGHLVSRFLRNRKNDEYVLLIFRYACDDDWFKKVRLLADEFGSVNDGETASKVHVLENSDMLISDDAFYTLGEL
ncbi:MAG: adaptor protein MecA [Lachnospiraceae bacterium]|nr:adaptor protein MecA [Lachnospiraceae bacterium]